MFARILEFELKTGKREEFLEKLKNEVLPLLKQQIGFLELLPFLPEKAKDQKLIFISLWTARTDAERYEKNIYPEVREILKPCFSTPVLVKPYLVETSLCEHFVHALAA